MEDHILDVDHVVRLVIGQILFVIATTGLMILFRTFYP